MALKIFKTLTFLLLSDIALVSAQKLQLVSGDFHQHTSFSDGAYRIDHVMYKNDLFGLDWWAINDHGGGSLRDGRSYHYDDLSQSRVEVFWDQVINPSQFKGNLSTLWGHRKMWMWQCLKEYSFPKVLEARSFYPDKVIFQGFEMNLPGHQHANLCILDDQFDENAKIDRLAAFEYRFDDLDLDLDGGMHQGWDKSKVAGHQKAVEAIIFLQTNYKRSSWLILAHPDWINPTKGFNIESIRELNDIAPDVCFGFEGMPGSQKNRVRGLYEYYSVGGGTYGGAGYYTSKIGGLWDALLSEGRHWWIFTNSDNHVNTGTFYPGEYQLTYTWVEDKSSPQSILDGLRSGNSFIETGELIDHLEFTVNDVPMGGTAVVKNNLARIKIRIHDPQGINKNIYSPFNAPELNHFDLIAGKVSGKISPSDARYHESNVSTTTVIARFDKTGDVTDASGMKSSAWTDLGNGWYEVDYDYNITSDSYFRLRGTNLGLNTLNETDAYGNPLCDNLVGENTPAKAFNDLWFYSNPVFVKIESATNNTDSCALAIQVFPNPSSDGHITLKSEVHSGFISVFDLFGKLVYKSNYLGGEKIVDLSPLASGIYTLRFQSEENTQSVKVVIK
jgi:hypothetical protein